MALTNFSGQYSCDILNRSAVGVSLLVFYYFCIFGHRGYWTVVFFFYCVFARLYYQGDAGFLDNLGNSPTSNYFE